MDRLHRGPGEMKDRIEMNKAVPRWSKAVTAMRGAAEPPPYRA